MARSDNTSAAFADARAIQEWHRALDRHMDETGVTAMMRAWFAAHDREYHAFANTRPLPTSKAKKGGR